MLRKYLAQMSPYSEESFRSLYSGTGCSRGCTDPTELQHRSTIRIELPVNDTYNTVIEVISRSWSNY